jgi:UDP-N-acetylmuramoyl-L-alanyl-D-glutamate--2,6-diaminopimelate ligase
LTWMRNIRKHIPNEIVNLFRHLPAAVLANIIHGFPSRGIKFIGVTGTDGKTTTTNMIYRILKDAGKKVAMVSTINAEINGEKIDTGFHVTNPDYFALQKLIGKARDSGTEIFVLEVTSHGLEQYRTWGIKFEVGLITNITQEHLDYHGTWEKYFQAKAKLVKNARTSVLNFDENNYQRLKGIAAGKVVSYGISKGADVNASDIKFKLKIPGEFNILNALGAVAVAGLFGVKPREAIKTLEDFESLEGRMEEVKNKLGIKIIIDFAHTPNGLESALKALKEKNKGRLITLTGAEGYRDPRKRPLMGEIAARLSDFVIFTAVDPRGLIDEINSQMLEGAEKAGGRLGKNIFIENDRYKAIEFAVRKLAKKGDIVGIFGKGHEKSMNISGLKEEPWSDLEAVRKILDERQV